MAEKEILVTLASQIGGIARDHIEKRFSEAGYRLKAILNEHPLDEESLCEEIKDSSGYIIALEKLTPRVLDAAQQLKVVSKFGVGVDNIDVKAATERGIAVANCPGSNSNAVAELVIGLMITAARNTQNLCDELRRGNWNMSAGSELAGKRVGILGFGNIGRKVASYLRPFTSDIIVYDAFEDKKAEQEYGVRYTSLQEITETSDFITVHLPLLPETNHLINAKVLSGMKPGVILINAARGGIVDEMALFDAVQQGIVARAAVDVYEFEPPTESKLLTDERIIVLPHIGAGSVEATYNMANMAIDNVLAVLSGKPNPHPVLP